MPDNVFNADNDFKQFLLSIGFEDYSKAIYPHKNKFCFKLYPRRLVTGKTVIFDYINIQLQYGSAIMFHKSQLDLKTFCVFLIAKDPCEFKELLKPIAA